MKKIFLLTSLVALAIGLRAQTVSVAVTTTPCDSNGVLTATISGLTPPLTVTWYTGAGTTIHTGVTGGTDVLNGYAGGTANVNVTDASGGYAYGSTLGASPFTFTIATTPAACPAPGTATATVTGGTAPYTYKWINSTTGSVASTANPASLPGGGYDLRIKDAAGCVYGTSSGGFDSTSSAFIENMPPFTLSATTTTASCTNGTSTVSVAGSGTPPYSYLWNTGATTSSISSLIMGGYSVTVTDASGCSNTAYTEVIQSVAISSPITTTPATCANNDGSVTTFGSGGTAPYTYVWNTGATTQSVTGLTPGYYNVVATDANGCIGNGYSYVSASTPINVTYTTTPSSCTSATGSATLNITGGTSPYTVTWSTTGGATGTTLSGAAAGYYSFHVADAAGCTRDGTVNIPPAEAITLTDVTTPATCTASDGAVAVTPSGGTAPYSYSWNTGATSSSLSSVPNGYYSVTVTDALGCTKFHAYNVLASSPVSIGIATTDASCIFNNDGSATATPYGGTAPYSYSWSDGLSTSGITGLGSGYYYVSVTDAAGCTANTYTHVDYNHSDNSCYCTITGIVYNDANNNCVQDPGETGIPNIQIYCSGIGYTYTDASGNYSFIAPSGSYTISETVLAYYPLASCQSNNIPVTVTASAGCTNTVNFANTISTIHDMHISTWDYNFPVPGNTYNQVSIVSNEGTVSESSILAGYKADGQLGAPTFSPSGIFSGAPYSYTSGASFPALTPGASQVLYMDYTTPTDIPMSTSIVFNDSVVYAAPMSGWTSDYSPWNNVNYFTTVVLSSYDPNFVEVSPKGTGPTGLITYADSTLEYMVHFQNTGTYMAENIVVVDTLDANLDWSSLRPVYESGKCKVTLSENGIATFTFNNIDLPATGDASNGMFTYTIKTKHGLPLGTQFKNKAAIYFDYNAPVITNETLNTLGFPESVNNVTSAENAFSVYPNPATKSFYAVINSSNANGKGIIKVTDLSGRTMITKMVTVQQGTQNVAIDVNALAPGVYFVNFTEGGNVKTQKLLIMK